MKGGDAGRDGSGCMPARRLLNSWQWPAASAAMLGRPVSAAWGVRTASRRTVWGLPCVLRPDYPLRYVWAGDGPSSAWLA